MKTTFVQWKGKYLFADANSDIIRSIKRAFPHRMEDFLHIANLAQFEEEIMEQKHDYKGIFLAPSFYEKNHLMGLELCHEFSPAVPIFLFQDLTIKNSQMDISISQLGIQKLIYNEEELFQIITDIDESQEHFHSWAMDNQHIALAEIELENTFGYLPVVAQNFFGGTKSLYDLFVRLKSGKFLKILKAGDTIDFSRLESYLYKGVTHFFILKEDQECYMNYSFKLAQKIILKTRINDAAKAHPIIEKTLSTFEFLINNGLGSEAIDFTKNYTNNLQDLVNNLKKQDNNISQLLDYPNLFEHSVSTAIIASLLGRKRGLKSKELISILGLSCLLHDLGIYYQNEYNLGRPGTDKNTIVVDDMISEAEIELALHTSESISGETKKWAQIYTLHPTKGSKLVKNLPEFGEILDEIISQHHERSDGSGFPNGLIHDEINPLSLLIGISDEFVKFIQLKGGQEVPKDALFAFIDEIKGFTPDLKFDLKSVFA